MLNVPTLSGETKCIVQSEMVKSKCQKLTPDGVGNGTQIYQKKQGFHLATKIL